MYNEELKRVEYEILDMYIYYKKSYDGDLLSTKVLKALKITNSRLVTVDKGLNNGQEAIKGRQIFCLGHLISSQLEDFSTKNFTMDNGDIFSMKALEGLLSKTIKSNSLTKNQMQALIKFYDMLKDTLLFNAEPAGRFVLA